MNQKKIIVGIIAGLIFGVISSVLFTEEGFSLDLLIVPTVIGAILGFASTKTLKAPLWLLGAVVGAAFFVIIALRSGLWLDDILTGGIVGLLIGIIMQVVGPKLK